MHIEESAQNISALEMYPGAGMQFKVELMYQFQCQACKINMQHCVILGQMPVPLIEHQMKCLAHD